ncbi:unnamed protein product [Microthlaspi erraticum]|uniref:Uncharacterized protein n=1 Tax=Microthlaspi erraticum TaxID=1685480 RepID=A0A6D2IMM6_9BRAS|nr:unnamed protein product [Microthlaspi erraticum]
MDVNSLLNYPGENDSYSEVQSLEEIVSTVLNGEDEVEDDEERHVQVVTRGKSRDTQNKLRDGGDRKASLVDVLRNWTTAVTASCVMPRF